jgi:hypothetical protein
MKMKLYLSVGGLCLYLILAAAPSRAETPEDGSANETRIKLIACKGADNRNCIEAWGIPGFGWPCAPGFPPPPPPPPPPPGWWWPSFNPPGYGPGNPPGFNPPGYGPGNPPGYNPPGYGPGNPPGYNPPGYGPGNPPGYNPPGYGPRNPPGRGRYSPQPMPIEGTVVTCFAHDKEDTYHVTGPASAAFLQAEVVHWCESQTENATSCLPDGCR